MSSEDRAGAGAAQERAAEPTAEQPTVGEQPAAEQRTAAAPHTAAELYSRLASMFAGPDAPDAFAPVVIDVRAELAIACAREGRAEDAALQVEELAKDCRRDLDPQDPRSRRAQQAKDQVWHLIESVGEQA
jgi:hypothetical protein